MRNELFAMNRKMTTNKLKFKEKISNYVLENISVSQLPQIGLIGLEEDLESESLNILAGMNEKDNSFEIEEYYKKALAELKFEEPNKLDAGKILLIHYLKRMVLQPNYAFQYMVKIDNEIYKQINWGSIQKEKSKYVGEELGLEKLYTWYREIQDWKEGSRLLYFNELPKEKQKLKFEENLIKEAKELLEKLEQEGNTPYNK